MGNKLIITLALFLFAGNSLLFAQSQIPATISIASWNIELFGDAKSGDPVRLGRIASVVNEFDVIAIQEIVDAPSQGQIVVDRLPRN